MNKIGNILWGVVFIVLGVILGINALGIAHINIFFDGWWTLFIIVPSFIGIFKDSEKIGSIIALVIGITFLLCCQGLLDFEIIWRLLLPAILVIVGVWFIFRETISGKVNKEIKKISEDGKEINEYWATFSGQDLKFENEEFKGANLSAIFGTIKCDLVKAQINSDIVINAESIFGGIDIYVPSDVKIKVKSTPIFGGVSNKTTQIITEDSHTIYVNATSIFGGIDIK